MLKRRGLKFRLQSINHAQQMTVAMYAVSTWQKE